MILYGLLIIGRTQEGDLAMGRNLIQMLPPLRWYRSPIVHVPGVFLALVGYQNHELHWAWSIGAYVFGILSMTIVYSLERFNDSFKEN